MTDAPAAPQHERWPGLDTLRACAILLVIPSHARTWLKWPLVDAVGTYGWSGVDLFFVLSGFLIGTQLLRSSAREGRVDFRRFYLKRSFRILPCYLAVLALYYAWPAFREQPVIDLPWRFLLFIMNFGRTGDAFSHAWSLCVEEHFYLVFPLLVALYATGRLRRSAGWLVGFVLVGGVALRCGIFASGARFFPAIYRPTFTHLDGLTVGVALALLRERRPEVWARLGARPWLLFVVGLALVALGLWTFVGKPDFVMAAFSFPLVAFGFGGLVVTALSPGFWLARWRIPGAAWVAALAYTLYLTHKQMIHLAVTLVGPPDEQPVLTVALATLLVVGAASLLHYGIEKPCLRLRDRLLD